MDHESILNFLFSNLKRLDGGATYLGTYCNIPKDGLFTSQLTNRPSKSWPKAQILYTSTKEQNHPLNECVIKWVEMCQDYNNQYLLIRDNQTNNSYLIDYKGITIAKNEFIEGKLKSILDIKKYTIEIERGLNGDYLRAMRTKPFLLLAGISGTGKSRIVKQMAFESCPDIGDLRSDPTSPGNYCLIEVKPNWHDSTELLGYESRIGGAHYQVTPFVKFLTKAMLFPDVPFFVCLDEMNLAPVEQYFAEFLSVLESRTKLSNGTIVSEPLIKASVFSNTEYKKFLMHDVFDIGIRERNENGVTIYDNELSDAEKTVYESLAAHGLRIPHNVIVLGTVNMDETTHQFSRKVIDRAMTIEMNLPKGNPFMDFFNNTSELSYRDKPVEAGVFLANETRAADAIAVLTAVDADNTKWLKTEIATFLSDLNSALANTPFAVAYRVQNELVLYFYELWIERGDSDWQNLLNIAIDQILMMKVLPRIEGDEELLEKPLENLITTCKHYSNAIEKLEYMKRRLSQSLFTSFWP